MAIKIEYALNKGLKHSKLFNAAYAVDPVIAKKDRSDALDGPMVSESLWNNDDNVSATNMSEFIATEALRP